MSNDELTVEEMRQAERIALAARVEQAMSYANVNRKMLLNQLMTDYGVDLSRSGLSKILGAKVRYTRYAYQIAQVLAVNPQWLSSGEETMTDLTGRLSSKQRGVRDLRRIAKDYVIPPKRADIVRYFNRLVASIKDNKLSHDDIELMNLLLRRMVQVSDEDESHGEDHLA